MFLIFFVSCNNNADETNKLTELNPEVLSSLTSLSDIYINACVIQHACELYSGGIDECLQSSVFAATSGFNSTVFKKQFNDYMLCLNEIESCESVKECEKTYLWSEFTNIECNENDFIRECDGTKISYCRYDSTGKTYIRMDDCALKEEICEVDKYNHAHCVKPIPVECSENFLKCDGNIKKQCVVDGEYKYYEEEDCSKVGLECSTKYGNPACLAKEDALSCEGMDKIACDGENIVICESGKKVTYNCREYMGDAYTCIEYEFEGSKYYECLSPLFENCTDEPSCEGDVLKYCFNNEMNSFDCKLNGFTSCQNLNSSPDQPDENKIYSTCVY